MSLRTLEQLPQATPTMDTGHSLPSLPSLPKEGSLLSPPSSPERTATLILSEERIHSQPTYEKPASVENRLRSAADVISRIIWDPDFDREDFVIVYEDRFEGRLEASFNTWKRDTTHEEFIPQHRILHIKRRSDGEVVWDRRRRIDKVFLSGNSAFDYLGFLT
ncbi:DUF504 domain-containing protein, partial [Aspergillus saccharolyticus JOP 1030-1]